jgi:hypothetical protein
MRAVREIISDVITDESELAESIEYWQPAFAPPAQASIPDRTDIRGNPISPDLPEAYQPAQGAEQCDNCEYYDLGMCARWNGAQVEPDYWCAKWEPIKMHTGGRK